MAISSHSLGRRRTDSWDSFVRRAHQITKCLTCFQGVARTVVYRVIAARPILFFCFVFILCGIAIFFGAVQNPPDFDTDLESMLSADVNSTLYYEAFVSAKASQETTQSNSNQTEVYRTFDLIFGYENTTSADGALGFETIYGIRNFESKIRELSAFAVMCASSEATSRSLCNPGVSFANYMMPTQTLNSEAIVPNYFTLNGAGRDTIPVSAAVRLANLHGLDPVMLPIGMSHSSSRAKFLRSVFRFRLHLGKATDPASARQATEEKLVDDWKNLVKDVLSVLEEESDLDAYVTGDFVQHVDVMNKLKPDMLLAIGSYGFVLMQLMVYTQSVILSIGGVVIVSMSIALAYAIFALVGTQVLSITCFLTIFVLPGLGSHVLFIYRDAWEESSTESAEIGERLSWTYRMGGKDSLVGSVIMSAAFFACLASVLRPLRDLAMFLGCALTIAWILATLLFVPLCIVNERCANCNDALGLGCFTIQWQKWLQLYIKLLNIRRLPVLAFFLLAMVPFLVVTLLYMETDMSVPNIFPESHNQNRGVALFADNFKPLIEIADFGSNIPDVNVDICTAEESQASSSPCLLFWCDTKLTRPLLQQFPSNVSCTCNKRDLPSTCGNQAGTAKHRFAGLSQATTAELRDAMAAYLTARAGSYGLKLQEPFSQNFSTSSLNSLMQYDWGAGVGELTSWTETTAFLNRAGSTSASCGWEEICFCGSSTCELPDDWKSAHSMSLPIPAQQVDSLYASVAAEGSGLVPERSRIKIMVAFGLHVKESSSIVGKRDGENTWSFLESFSASNLQAQRDMKKLCTDIPTNFNVVVKSCWILRFEGWLLEQGEKFPAIPSRFPSLIKQFAAAFPKTEAPFLWVIDDVLKAAYFEFTADVDRKSDLWKLYDYMQLWDGYISDWNTHTASPYVRGAWHTSEVWPSAESHEKMMNSMALTLTLVCGCVFAVILFSTTDLVLSLYAFLVANWTLWAMLFGLLVFMSRDFGPVQVLILNSLAGYAFISAVHIVLKYRDVKVDLLDPHSERYERVSQTLSSIGCVVLGSGTATVGTSIFMLPCELSIFSTVGVALLLVPLLATIVAMVPLIALLLLFGPTHPGTLLGFYCVRTWEFRSRAKSPPDSPRGVAMDSLESTSEVLATIPEHAEEDVAPPDPTPTGVSTDGRPSRNDTNESSKYSMDASTSSSNERFVAVAPGSDGAASSGALGVETSTSANEQSRNPQLLNL